MSAIERENPAADHGPLFVIAGSHASLHWCVTILLILLPFIKVELGLDYTQTGLLVTILQLAAFVANIPSGIIVDVTHLTDQAHWELLEIYDGPIAASHHNCRALTPGQRQLTDEMIRSIAERGGVIGTAFDAWMLDPDWQRKVPPYEQVTKATLETVADHTDHICQLLGTSRHCGIGTDLAGGGGTEQAPRNLNTIADLQKLVPIYEQRGYSADDIAGIFSGNWIRLFKEVWSR